LSPVQRRIEASYSSILRQKIAVALQLLAVVAACLAIVMDIDGYLVGKICNNAFAPAPSSSIQSSVSVTCRLCKTWRFVFALVKHGFGENCLAVVFCTASRFQSNASSL
jgi:hypothetical protein